MKSLTFKRSWFGGTDITNFVKKFPRSTNRTWVMYPITPMYVPTLEKNFQSC